MKNLTRKYEDTPNPSQPSIKRIKLLLKINIYIEVTKLNKINKNQILSKKIFEYSLSHSYSKSNWIKNNKTRENIKGPNQ